MPARTSSADFASGSSVAGMESGEIQEGVSLRRGDVDGDVESTLWTASRSRETVRAANMSPVPEKKQSSCGTSMRKRRGVPSERIVDPTTARVLERGVVSWFVVEFQVSAVEWEIVDEEDDETRSGRCTDVTIMWGTCSLRWMTLIASARLEKQVIFTPERSLQSKLVTPTWFATERGALTLLRTDLVVSDQPAEPASYKPG